MREHTTAPAFLLLLPGRACERRRGGGGSNKLSILTTHTNAGRRVPVVARLRESVARVCVVVRFANGTAPRCPIGRRGLFFAFRTSRAAADRPRRRAPCKTSWRPACVRTRL